MKYPDFPEEDTASAERRIIAGLFDAVPALEESVGADYPRWDDWRVGDGMCFMNGLLRACDRMADDPEQSSALKGVFDYLEMLARRLESTDESGESSLIDKAACDFLLFTFTDNPTGRDPEFVKLSPFMGPRIKTMCTIC